MVCPAGRSVQVATAGSNRAPDESGNCMRLIVVGFDPYTGDAISGPNGCVPEANISPSSICS
jgi:hypothetical protein